MAEEPIGILQLAVVGKKAKKSQPYNNVVYVNPADHATLLAAGGSTMPELLQEGTGVLIGIVRELRTVPFYALPLDVVERGTIEMASPQRNSSEAAKNERLDIVVLKQPPNLTHTAVFISPVGSNTRLKMVDAGVFAGLLHAKYDGHAFVPGHEVVVKYERAQVRVKFRELYCNGPGDVAASVGTLAESSEIAVRGTKDCGLNIVGQASTQSKQVVGADFNFLKMGIGGLNDEFQFIFRKAFASRAAAPATLAALGQKHTRGMLLYGPPGCGKTLIARKIGEALKARPPKIVNGPECLSKWVGGSEENIRKLFAEAEEEQKERGDDSDLHIIIFDEIDAICKKRGSTRDNTGVHDSVVNQLLSKIDGVDSLNNILLIGMTNRLDMIDEALLRPGRLSIHVEIGLPNEEGRQQILNIHTATMRNNGRISSDVSLPYWAKMTKNFTGAEIEGLVQNATSQAFDRHTNKETMQVIDSPDNPIIVTNRDFELGFAECNPAFGLKEDELTPLYRLGVFDYGPAFRDLWESLTTSISTLTRSVRTNKIACLLYGDPGVGKTALAAKLAAYSAFPFVKRVSAESLVGQNEYSKGFDIISAFSDAYKTGTSVLIIDDIERIIEYVGGAGGARFANNVLQTLMTMIRRPPVVVDHKLFIICTTSKPREMAALGLGAGAVFDMAIEVPRLDEASQVAEVVRQMATTARAQASAKAERNAGKRESKAGRGEDGDESKGDVGVRPEDYDVFDAAAAAKIGDMLTADGRGVSIKSLLRLLDTIALMDSGTLEERLSSCMRQITSFR